MTNRSPIDWPALQPIKQSDQPAPTQGQMRELWARMAEFGGGLRAINAEVERLSALAERPWLGFDSFESRHDV